MNNTHQFFATAPLGLELLLAEELRALGGEEVAEARAGVSFSGPLSTAYRACLWSRLANRVLLKLATFSASTPEQLYRGIQDIDWSEHFSADENLSVDFTSSRSQITHTQFGAQKVKDAVVDQFRERIGKRPSVRTDRPDIRINVYVDRDQAQVSLDLSGESLHRRGYRLEGGSAPLKENLAAAILLRARWPEIAEAGGSLIDPLCGSGTLPIEAAAMAADIAPGLDRDYFGFLGWRQHQAEIWAELVQDAALRKAAGLRNFPLTIVGYDRDRRAIQAAEANLERAGLTGVVQFEQQHLADARPPGPQGLIVANPPYGERLGDSPELVQLYTELGAVLRSHFSAWKAGVFTGNPDMAFKLGIRARRFYKLYNGALECKLFLFDVEPTRYFTPHPDESGLSEQERGIARIFRKTRSLTERDEPIGAGAEMFANRLRKNLKHLGRWARQNGIDCFRVYDADLPEYALAVDLYRSEAQQWVHIQEYEAPASIDPERAEQRLIEALSTLPATLGVPQERQFLKIRRKQKGSAQYEKRSDSGHFHEVSEHGCRLLVNFEDYLDTGLFLDHRPTRLRIQQTAKDQRFLNLFAYTGSATVHAAVGGASRTTTVDMSHTYLEWADRNLSLNGFRGYDHELVQSDCLAWLEGAGRDPDRRYDLIFLDPPTFSNSKRMDASFDVQRDHAELLEKSARLLAPGGTLLFSTNFRKFRLNSDALPALRFENISVQTIPKDFERNPKIHCCWSITQGR